MPTMENRRDGSPDQFRKTIEQETKRYINMANEIEKIKVELPDPELLSLADKIVQVIEEGKQALAISINETIKTTYWKIGRHIVEFEQ